MGNQTNGSVLSTLEQNVELLKKNFVEHQRLTKDTMNVEFKIIEWHSKIRKDNLDRDLEKISPDNIEKIRGFVNDTLLDVMLYMTPEYHTEILNEVSSQINATYNMFINHHPKFRGLVSIWCHSLGSVIVWDILHSKHIGFQVENVFAMGSPLGIFLRLKGHPLGNVDFRQLIPQCSNWFNIFSPTDPVAYRIEPFIDNKYQKLKPVVIELGQHERPSTLFDIYKKKFSGLIGQISSPPQPGSLSPNSKPMHNLIATQSIHQQLSTLDGTITQDSTVSIGFTSSYPDNVGDIVPSIGGGYGVGGEIKDKEDESLKDLKRYDYVLDEGSTIWNNGIPSYFISILSHITYWNSKVMASFLVKSLSIKWTKVTEIAKKRNRTLAKGLANLLDDPDVDMLSTPNNDNDIEPSITSL
ncbi:hypothetical protein SAMD00019534_045900 [Acytostelium subglobosum LB1]|uniref:hypothetical protein n=1 Tax=Acytostelium subglobosum LB1 TaxID=1410327 RepID=UPI000644C466|nr:hypothetical protein SAMD00019534_045900 [Acytostelium subglobosum LB1]GAM21415.1 hypothetical protein SAMD00019534_045900 [Acytostelium subglobosum LB1]|eukprot:XP_012755534.1 hypothetical protein SAMD00019534_045900 [Acytostelium subglobosum LB1]